MLDTVDNFNGLERLIVIAVGLDAPIRPWRMGGAADAETSWNTLEVRARLDRAITRAHMLAMVVNEQVSGGWLEWLSRVELEEEEEFDREKELQQHKKGATQAAVAQAAAAGGEGKRKELTWSPLTARKRLGTRGTTPWWGS